MLGLEGSKLISGDRDTVGCIVEVSKSMTGDGAIEFRNNFEYFWEKIAPLRYRLKSIIPMED